MPRILSSFLKSRNGNFGMAFAVALLPVALAIGAAVDYTGRSNFESKLQEITDASALAAASFKGTDAQKISHGEEMFAALAARFPDGLDPSVQIEITPARSIQATSEASYSTHFLLLGGYKELAVGGYAEVNLAGVGRAEMVFVLDYSSSMNSRYEAMRDAVINLIDETTGGYTSPDVKIGLVPFAREVYASMDGRYVNGGTLGVTWSNCTRGRKWPFVWKDDTPTGAQASKWGLLDNDDYADVEDPDYYEDCENYTDNNLVVRPLSTNHNTTVAQLMAMTPHSGTNISLGVQFGFQVISPNAPWTEGVSYSDSDWKKFLIVLSDGRHNREGFGPGSIFTEAQGRENMQRTCDRAKSLGITIITVAYEIDDDEGKDELRQCATDDNYYLEGSEDNVLEVFGTVGELMAGDPYLSK